MVIRKFRNVTYYYLWFQSTLNLDDHEQGITLLWYSTFLFDHWGLRLVSWSPFCRGRQRISCFHQKIIFAMKWLQHSFHHSGITSTSYYEHIPGNVVFQSVRHCTRSCVTAGTYKLGCTRVKFQVCLTILDMVGDCPGDSSDHRQDGEWPSLDDCSGDGGWPSRGW